MKAQSKGKPIFTKEAKATIEEVAQATGLDVQKVISMLFPYSSKKARSKKAGHMAAWRAANREKDRATRAAWREKNREKVRASKKVWCEANKEKQLAFQRAWRAADRERALNDPVYHAQKKAKARAYKAANKDKVKAWQAAWWKANKDKMNAKRSGKKSS